MDVDIYIRVRNLLQLLYQKINVDSSTSFYSLACLGFYTQMKHATYECVLHKLADSLELKKTLSVVVDLPEASDTIEHKRFFLENCKVFQIKKKYLFDGELFSSVIIT